MSERGWIPGLIVKAQSGFFEVETKTGRYTAQLRGRLKQKRLDHDVIAVGDRVQISVPREGHAQVERVEERQRALSRQAPGREFEQVIVANPDQAVFVFACADPEPSLRMLDRFLVVAEREQIPARICANKVDLIGIQDARDLFGIYEEIGYDVIYTSALTGEGLAALKEMFSGRISVLAGPSGVGKSSLLNALQPGLGQRTKAISLGTRKGQHTTVAPELIPLEGGGYVADTPGLKAFALWDIEAEEVDAYFREIGPLVADCTFSNCSHTHEPGCAVKEALARGDLALQRYESYLRLRKGDLD